MKKVKYGITRYTKKGSYRFTGYGQLDGNDLITTYIDKNVNKVKHIYEDCLKSLQLSTKLTNSKVVSTNTKKSNSKTTEVNL